MDPNRLEELISGYVTGTLSEPEWAELGTLLRESEEAGDALELQLLIDRLMRESGKGPADADAILRTIGSGQTPALADVVLQRIAETKAEGGPRKSRVRPAPRFHARPRRSSWVFGLIAAGLFVAVIVTVAVSNGKPPQPAARRDEAAKIVTPREDAPVVLPPEPGERKPSPVPVPEPPLPAPDKPAPEPRKPEVAPTPVKPATEAVAKPEPEKRPAPEPVPAPAPPQPGATVAPVATLERVEGQVFIIGPKDGDRTPGRVGLPLLPTQSVETEGGGTLAVLKFADSTRLKLVAESKVTLSGRDPFVSLARGELLADVVKQPKDQSFAFVTPHGEARVLGTSLRLKIDGNATRLEVWDGKVRLKRSDGRAIEVPSGHFAVAATGLLLTHRPLFTPNLLSDPGFESGGAGWKAFTTKAGRAVVQTPLHSGSRAQQIGGAGLAEYDLYQDVPVTAGTTYNAYAWMRCSGVAKDNKARVFVQWLDPSGRYAEAGDLGELNGTQDWTFVWGRFTAPPGTVKIRFYLHVGGDGLAWFDDAYLGVAK